MYTFYWLDGIPLEDLPYYEDQVGCPVCDIPPEAEMKVYIFHCWDPKCNGMGNSKKECL